MRFPSIAAGVIALCIGAGVGSAEEDFDPEPVIQARQAALRDIGGAFKSIGDELKKPAPSVPTITSNARQITQLMSHQAAWFPAGTGPESDIDTMAKAQIWEAPEEFATLQAAFGDHARKLEQVAGTGDVAAIRAQWRELGRTCKSCHDSFREED